MSHILTCNPEVNTTIISFIFTTIRILNYSPQNPPWGTKLFPKTYFLLFFALHVTGLISASFTRPPPSLCSYISPSTVTNVSNPRVALKQTKRTVDLIGSCDLISHHFCFVAKFNFILGFHSTRHGQENTQGIGAAASRNIAVASWPQWTWKCGTLQ